MRLYTVLKHSKFPSGSDGKIWLQCRRQRFLGQEDSMEEGMASHSCNPQGQRSLEGYSPWGCNKSDMAERATLSLPSYF